MQTFPIVGRSLITATQVEKNLEGLSITEVCVNSFFF